MHMGGGAACRDSIRAVRDILPQVCAPVFLLPPRQTILVFFFKNFFGLIFTWNIFFTPFTFKFYILLYFRCISNCM